MPGSPPTKDTIAAAASHAALLEDEATDDHHEEDHNAPEALSAVGESEETPPPLNHVPTPPQLSLVRMLFPPDLVLEGHRPGQGLFSSFLPTSQSSHHQGDFLARVIQAALEVSQETEPESDDASTERWLQKQ